MKWLSPKVHGILDMAVTLMLFAAPTLFGFGREASVISYTLGAVYVLLILTTAYPWGMAKVIPFTVHGAMEFVLSPLLVAMPWLAGFSYDTAGRAFFMVAGIGLFLVWATTDYKAADRVFGKDGIGSAGKRRIRVV